ncbi:MAG: Gfo/Idh/MocA family oxidoreductase [Planctomycetota bacterium]|nr:Gfo/Idh/MocA family oxidoreductase [Planctomycetota bacterium]
MKPQEVVIVGCGGRGHGYGKFAVNYPQEMKVVAVAEPNEARRERMRAEHNLPAERCFKTYDDLYAKGPLADALINGTMDRDHLPSTLGALKTGYHVLLEKPIASTPEDCVALVRASQDAGKILMICHTMRYCPFAYEHRRIMDSGRLGEIVTIEHKENVAYWHMAHSFVRGNWRNSVESSPMILQKCCHDMDYLYWMIGRKAVRMMSYGSLTHFRRDRVGPEIPERCTDGCPIEADCPYSALKHYAAPDGRMAGWVSHSPSFVHDGTLDGKLNALRTGPFGRCVFRCDNDVVDHMVIAAEFEGGLTLAFTMHGHSHDNVRTMRYSGTKGTLRAHMDENELTIHDYATGREETIRPGHAAGGHGGGDYGVTREFIRALRDRNYKPLTNVVDSLESHFMAFAAEESRVTGKQIEMAEYRARFLRKAVGAQA